MTLSPLSIAQTKATATLSAIATVVTIRYAYDWQAADYNGSVTYTAAEQVKQFGRIEKVVEAPFCATSRQACRLAQYWTQRLSLPQYLATIETDRSCSNIQIADRIELIHPHLPGGYTDGALVTGREYNPETGAVTLDLLLPAVLLPEVTLSGYSSRVTQAPKAGGKWQPVPGDAGITVLDDKGTVITGAIVTLDGTTKTTSDGSGLALFNGLSAGKHTITITFTGYQPVTMDITSNGTPVESSIRLTPVVIHATPGD